MKNLKLFGCSNTYDGKRNILLTWYFFSDNDFPEEFAIEKSADNKEFKMVEAITKIVPSERMYHYLFIDKNPNYGNNYYRIAIRRKESGRLKKIILKSNTVTVNIIEDRVKIDC